MLAGSRKDDGLRTQGALEQASSREGAEQAGVGVWDEKSRSGWWLEQRSWRWESSSSGELGWKNWKRKSCTARRNRGRAERSDLFRSGLYPHCLSHAKAHGPSLRLRSIRRNHAPGKGEGLVAICLEAENSLESLRDSCACGGVRLGFPQSQASAALRSFEQGETMGDSNCSGVSKTGPFSSYHEKWLTAERRKFRIKKVICRVGQLVVT
ncbi:uncharacterized protein BDV14DRAFT_199347 [Aspergillus stella-maris]|uniref:uncharacterized protein n=1 Tax=Aspergillus stella-maris TaxID=1810926 RepID=UPI003CCDDB0D